MLYFALFKTYYQDKGLSTRGISNIVNVSINAVLIISSWIACNATNLFKDSWRQAEAWLVHLVRLVGTKKTAAKVQMEQFNSEAAKGK